MLYVKEKNMKKKNYSEKYRLFARKNKCNLVEKHKKQLKTYYNTHICVFNMKLRLWRNWNVAVIKTWLLPAEISPYFKSFLYDNKIHHQKTFEKLIYKKWERTKVATDWFLLWSCKNAQHIIIIMTGISVAWRSLITGTCRSCSTCKILYQDDSAACRHLRCNNHGSCSLLWKQEEDRMYR